MVCVIEVALAPAQRQREGVRRGYFFAIVKGAPSLLGRRCVQKAAPADLFCAGSGNGGCQVKWFKHTSSIARTDPGFAHLLASGGLEAWGFCWRIHEIVGEMWSPDAEPALTLPVRAWCQQLGVHRNRFEKLLKIAKSCGVLAIKPQQNPKFAGGMSADTLTLVCPKLLDWQDEYSRKSGRTPDSVTRRRRTKEEEKDQDQANDQRSKVGVSRRNGSSKSPDTVGLQPDLVRSFAERMAEATGDSGFLRNGTLKAIGEILAAGRADDLDAEVDHVCKDQDPTLAEARGFAWVREPAPYMQAALSRLRKTQ